MENFSLPVPDFHLMNQLIQAQNAADNEVETHEKRLLGQIMLAKHNDGQRAAFDQIMASIEDVDQTGLFFLDCPGGTGKTFLYNTLITVLQGHGKSVVKVASTEITSSLLINGSTYFDGINHLFQMVAKNSDDPYGNKVLLLGGDLRQCLPVFRHGNQVKIIESTIKSSKFEDDGSNPNKD
jgi:hypothetical protein